MIPAIERHLLESTLFTVCVAVLVLVCGRRLNAASRHSLWLIAAAKFAVPAAVFSLIGIFLGSIFPSTKLIPVNSPGVSNLLSYPVSTLPHPAPASPVTVAVIALWLGGAGIMFARWLYKLAAPEKATTSPTDSEIEILSTAKRRIGLHRTIDLRHSSANLAPCLAGVWKPTIKVPHALSSELTRSQFETVLLHELAHARRWDNLWNRIVHALVCIFWFHPFLWWIERRMAAECEFACDEMVLQCGADPEEYAGGIMKVCRFHLDRADVAACSFTGSVFSNRMEVIMSFASRNPALGASKFLLVALASLVTLVPLALGFLGSTPVNAQTAKGNKGSAKETKASPPVSCAGGSKSFLEGTVIQYDNGAQRMCVKGPNDYPMWVRTNEAIRERSKKVVPAPPSPLPPGFLCEPGTSTNDQVCNCQGSGEFSVGAIVPSAQGALRCEKGGKWRAATPAELGESK